MRSVLLVSFAIAAILAVPGAAAQQPDPAGSSVQAPDRPLPEIPALLADVERNQKRLEGLQKDYTYHVHLVRESLDGHGRVTKRETTEAESVAVQGVRIDRVVARDGKPLTPEEQAKEDARVDKEVARARERRAKAAANGAETDSRGDTVLSLSRILELGSFSNATRTLENGRPTIMLDYAGNPNAKTHTPFEGVMRDLVGKVWIDEADRVLVRGEARFLNDFKLGGGLVADLHKGTSFTFRATRVQDAVWLPAQIDGEGSVRVLLLASFKGRLHLETSDYRRFRTSTTILPGHGVVEEPSVSPGQGGDKSGPVVAAPHGGAPQR